MRHKPYKQVIIFGPDHNGAFSNDFLTAPKDEDCLIIGDGKKNVTLNEIKQLLQGHINEATRIDVCAHGDTNPYDATGTHYIELSADMTATLKLFKLFNQANDGKPIYCHLWGCYSNNADKEFSHLPEGSLAVFHSSKNSLSFNTAHITKFNYNEHDNTIEGAKKNLSVNLRDIIELGGTIKFSKTGKEYSVKYVIPEVVETHKGYFDFIYNYLHKKGEEITVQASDDIEQDILKLIDNINNIVGLNNNYPLIDISKLKEHREHNLLRNLVESKSYYSLNKALNTLNLDVNSQNDSGQPCLFWVNDNKITQLLIDKGVNVNKQDNAGWAPLMYAVRDNNYDIVNMLLNAGANPNLCNNDGHNAIFHTENTKIAQLLIDKGANVNRQDIEGLTPLIYAVRDNNYDMVNMLLNAGANPNLCNNGGHNALFYTENTKIAQLLIDKGANVNKQDNKGSTPLMHAVYKNNYDLAKTLLNAEANPNLLDNDGYIALFDAKDTKILKLLIESGANVNFKTKDGTTPLMVALKYNQPELVDIYLQANANPFIKDKTTQLTAYDLLVKQNPVTAKKIEERILEQKNPLQYLVTCHESKSDLLKTLEQIKNSNLYIYQEIGILKIKRYLNETTIIGQQPVSNFRKLIKEQDLEALKLALEYEPIVTSKDIEMAGKIFGNQLPATTLEAMQKLADKQQIQHESNHTSKLKDKNSQPRNKYR